MNLEEMHQKIKETQTEKRYQHTLGVIETAVALAEQYGEDKEKTYLAALLHDCAKSFSTNLLHAKDGARMAEEEYHIEDSYILDAISYHTTGRPNMSLLDKIIYIADYIEPNRLEAPNLEELRSLAFEDLDLCLYRILNATLEYLQSKHIDIDPMTEDAYLYYKKQMHL